MSTGVCSVIEDRDWFLMATLLAALPKVAEKMVVLRQFFWDEGSGQWNVAVKKVYQKVSLGDGQSRKRGRSAASGVGEAAVPAAPKRKATASKSTPSPACALPVSAGSGGASPGPFAHPTPSAPPVPGAPPMLLQAGAPPLTAARPMPGPTPPRSTAQPPGPLHRAPAPAPPLPLLHGITPDRDTGLVTLVGEGLTPDCTVQCHLAGQPQRWTQFGSLQPHTLRTIPTGGGAAVCVAHCVVDPLVFPEATGAVVVAVFAAAPGPHPPGLVHPEQFARGCPTFHFFRPPPGLVPGAAPVPVCGAAPGAAPDPTAPAPDAAAAGTPAPHDPSLGQSAGPGPRMGRLASGLGCVEACFLLEMQEHVTRVYCMSAQQLERAVLHCGGAALASARASGGRRALPVLEDSGGLVGVTGCRVLQRRLPAIVAELFGAKARVAAAEAAARAHEETSWFTHCMDLTLRHSPCPRVRGAAHPRCHVGQFLLTNRNAGSASRALLVYVSRSVRPAPAARAAGCERDALLLAAMLESDGFAVQLVREGEVSLPRLAREIAALPSGLQRLAVFFLGHGCPGRVTPDGHGVPEAFFVLRRTDLAAGPGIADAVSAAAFARLVDQLRAKAPRHAAVLLDFCHAQGITHYLGAQRALPSGPTAAGLPGAGASAPGRGGSVEVVHSCGADCETPDDVSFSRRLVDVLTTSTSSLSCSMSLSQATRMVSMLPDFRATRPGLVALQGTGTFTFGPWRRRALQAARAEINAILGVSLNVPCLALRLPAIPATRSRLRRRPERRVGAGVPHAEVLNIGLDEGQVVDAVPHDATAVSGHTGDSLDHAAGALAIAVPAPASLTPCSTPGPPDGQKHDPTVLRVPQSYDRLVQPRQLPVPTLTAQGHMYTQALVLYAVEARRRQQMLDKALMWRGAMTEALARGQIVAEEESELVWTLEQNVCMQSRRRH